MGEGGGATFPYYLSIWRTGFVLLRMMHTRGNVSSLLYTLQLSDEFSVPAWCMEANFFGSS